MLGMAYTHAPEQPAVVAPNDAREDKQALLVDGVADAVLSLAAGVDPER
jgi:hypothetical protein